MYSRAINADKCHREKRINYDGNDFLQKEIKLKRSACCHYVTWSRTVHCTAESAQSNKFHWIQIVWDGDWAVWIHSTWPQSSTIENINFLWLCRLYYRPTAHMLVTRWPSISPCRYLPYLRVDDTTLAKWDFWYWPRHCNWPQSSGGACTKYFSPDSVRQIFCGFIVIAYRCDESVQ